MKTRSMAAMLACMMVMAGMARAAGQGTGTGGEPAVATAGQATTGEAPGLGRGETTKIDPAEVAADVLVVRPAGVAATALGAVIYVLALPFAAIAGDVKETGRILVGTPAKFTFRRKLGDFESGGL